MTLEKQSMEKRAEMKEFIKVAKEELHTKYLGRPVNAALCEVMADEMTDMVKQAFPDEPQPAVRVDYIGTRAVTVRIKFENPVSAN